MPIPIKNLLSYSVNKAGVGREVEAARIIDWYKKEVKELRPDLLPFVRPIKFSNQSLVVQVKSSPAASELRMIEHKILEAINKNFTASNKIQRVSYRIG